MTSPSNMSFKVLSYGFVTSVPSCIPYEPQHCPLISQNLSLGSFLFYLEIFVLAILEKYFIDWCIWAAMITACNSRELMQLIGRINMNLEVP